MKLKNIFYILSAIIFFINGCANQKNKTWIKIKIESEYTAASKNGNSIIKLLNPEIKESDINCADVEMFKEAVLEFYSIEKNELLFKNNTGEEIIFYSSGNSSSSYIGEWIFLGSREKSKIIIKEDNILIIEMEVLVERALIENVMQKN